MTNPAAGEGATVGYGVGTYASVSDGGIEVNTVANAEGMLVGCAVSKADGIAEGTPDNPADGKTDGPFVGV